MTAPVEDDRPLKPKRSLQERFGTRLQFWALASLLLCLLLVILRNAWISDDAYITFRAVDNSLNGHGLRWNVEDRVLVYSNPLMAFCMMALSAITGEVYFTSLFVGGATSAAALWILLFRFAGTIYPAVSATALLLSSKAFIDYTTSGLENSISYLLMAFVYAAALGDFGDRNTSAFSLSLLGSVILLNRIDTFLLCLPLLTVALWQRRNKRNRALIFLGALPFIAWELFALVYYGTLVPNTAPAKLGTGLPLPFYLQHGLDYYQNSLRLDPITLPTIAIVVIALLLSFRARHVAAGLGILLYLLYVLRIGGDFMSGRFFSVPMFCAVLCFAALMRNRPSRLHAATLVVGLSAMTWSIWQHPFSPIRSDSNYRIVMPELQSHHHPNAKGIADERAFYYPRTGFLTLVHHGAANMPAHRWRREGLEMRRSGHRVFYYNAVGMRAFFAGPFVHIVDMGALADPLLARLPVRAEGDQPRIGHMWRPVPAGYFRSLESGVNHVQDPQLAQLFTAVRCVSRGPIWSKNRWRNIWRLNTGWYDDLIVNSSYPEMTEFVPEGAVPMRPASVKSRPRDLSRADSKTDLCSTT